MIDHRPRDRPRRDRAVRELHRVAAFGRRASATSRGRSRSTATSGLIENDSENDATGEGINLDVVNSYDVHADGDGVRIDYESRNSVSPVRPRSAATSRSSPTTTAGSTSPRTTATASRRTRPTSTARARRDNVIEQREAGEPDRADHAARPARPAEPARPARAAARPPRPAGPAPAAEPAEPAEPPGPAGPAANLPDLPGPLPDLPDLPTCRTCPDDAAPRHAARRSPRCCSPAAAATTSAAPPRRRRPRPPPRRDDGPAGSFPAAPQLVDDFSDPGSGWPRAGYREGVYVVVGRGTVAVLAPARDPPAGRAARSPRSSSSRRAAAARA